MLNKEFNFDKKKQLFFQNIEKIIWFNSSFSKLVCKHILLIKFKDIKCFKALGL